MRSLYIFSSRVTISTGSSPEASAWTFTFTSAISCSRDSSSWVPPIITCGQTHLAVIWWHTFVSHLQRIFKYLFMLMGKRPCWQETTHLGQELLRLERNILAFGKVGDTQRWLETTHLGKELCSLERNILAFGKVGDTQRWLETTHLSKKLCSLERNVLAPSEMGNTHKPVPVRCNRRFTSDHVDCDWLLGQFTCRHHWVNATWTA